jgi:hypothetical protein
MHLASFQKKFFITVILLLLAPLVHADTPWQFEVAPYLWALNMDGKTSVGPTTATINESFNDILKHLNFAGMLYATAHKDNFGLYFNGIYAVTSDSGTFTTPLGGININVKNKYGIFGGGLSYIIYNHLFSNQSILQFEPILGARYTLNNTKLTLNQFSVSKNVNWTDPVIGLKARFDFNPRWSITLMGDLGGTSTSTDYSYSASGLIGYQPSTPSLKHVSTYLGYRLLKQKYITGSGIHYYQWNMRLFGPLLGVALHF